MFDTEDVSPTIREEVSLSLLHLHLSYSNTDPDYSLTSNHVGDAGGVVNTLKTSPETNVTFFELSASGFESQVLTSPKSSLGTLDTTNPFLGIYRFQWLKDYNFGKELYPP